MIILIMKKRKLEVEQNDLSEIKEILKKIHYRLGWILFWIILGVLGIANS